jgi:hypothetical protein
MNVKVQSPLNMVPISRKDNFQKRRLGGIVWYGRLSFGQLASTKDDELGFDLVAAVV